MRSPFSPPFSAIRCVSRLRTAWVERAYPSRSHRPSRGLPRGTGCPLPLDPGGPGPPGLADLSFARISQDTALMQAIDGLDLVRAHLLTEIVYRTRDRRSRR